MSVWIEGLVTQVIDGATFDMRVEWVGKSNSHRFGNTERVRIAAIDAPESGSPAGTSAHERLHRRLGGKNVHCTIQARDTFGRLVCHVKVVPKWTAA